MYLLVMAAFFFDFSRKKARKIARSAPVF